ncbi:MAG TPA: FRG domain-containing protein [Candidatus Binatia bacterium]|jgi:hypothetical protein
MDSKRHIFVEDRIESLDDLDRCFKQLLEPNTEQNHNQQWIFRGYKNSSWDFETKLQRAIFKFGLSDPTPLDKESKRALLQPALKEGLDALDKTHSVSAIEGGLLRRFKRQCHHYTMAVPGEANIMEWLALMQHYGAPTRLLDWTYSFWVAVYFAVEESEKECVVWALDSRWIRQRVKDRLNEVSKMIDSEYGGYDPNVIQRETFRDAFQSGKRFVFPINPYRLNERLVLQQGLFLCPGDISSSFEANLEALAGDRSGKKDFSGNLIKFIIKNDPQLRKTIMQRLQRMNLNRATLFPGLDGFSQSLEMLMVFPHILVPDPEWEK